MARILIAEDEPIIAGALQDDLTLEGYEVMVAGDGVGRHVGRRPEGSI
jgi:DNA-binding response OmpR family regulator